jgi:hypothetical protein
MLKETLNTLALGMVFLGLVSGGLALSLRALSSSREIGKSSVESAAEPGMLAAKPATIASEPATPIAAPVRSRRKIS